MLESRSLAVTMAVVAAVSVVAATGATTACTTHQCDPSCVYYGGAGAPYAGCVPGNADARGVSHAIGRVYADGDGLVWESGPMAGPWLDDPGQRDHFFLWPAPMAGHTPTEVIVSIAADPQAPQNGFVEGAGYIADVRGVNDVGMWVRNDSCAGYGLRVVARYVPSSPDAGPSDARTAE